LNRPTAETLLTLTVCWGGWLLRGRFSSARLAEASVFASGAGGRSVAVVLGSVPSGIGSGSAVRAEEWHGPGFPVWTVSLLVAKRWRTPEGPVRVGGACVVGSATELAAVDTLRCMFGWFGSCGLPCGSDGSGTSA